MQRCLLAVTSLMLLSSTALGAPTTIVTLPDKGCVTVEGMVEKVADRTFVLHDSKGDIDVKLGEAPSAAVFKKGDTVSVTGKVSTGFFGNRSIRASRVNVIKDRSITLANTSVEQAKTVQVDNLPREGMVQLTGTVDSIRSDKNFTLKDPTGTVPVEVQSAEKAALSKGTEVNVMGYVDTRSGAKVIHATRVIVTADATAKTGVSDTR